MTIHMAVVQMLSAMKEGKEWPIKRPFRLIESYETSDGPRTRVCNMHWETYEEAEAEMKRKMERVYAQSK